VKAESLSAKARSKIEELILEGSLVDKVTERDLAQRLKMSRAPIREAMRELLNVGLLERQGPRSIVVRELNVSEIEEIYHIRSILEARAAGLAAQKITKNQVTELNTLHNKMITSAKEVDIDNYYDLNILFHKKIHTAAHSPRLIALIDMVMKESLLFRSRGLVDIENIETSIKDHTLILDALTAKDAELASLFMSRHIEGGLARLKLVDNER